MNSKKMNPCFYFANSSKILPKSKHSQSEVITTVLIILLVLAAVIIVWQVVQSTIKSGGQQITEQNKCIGIDFAVKNTSATDWVVTRTSSGGSFTTVSLIVVQNGNRVTPTATEYSANLLNTPLGSGTFTIGPGTVTLEVGYIGDGATCSSTAKWP